MIFGPRAYRSNDSLFIQAVAQKVVVYSEIIVMLFQAVGTLKVLESQTGNQSLFRNDA